MEEKSNQIQSSETQSQEFIDLTNAEVTEKANEVWNRVKESPVTVEELDRLVPMGTEVLKGLVGIITKEIESGTKQYEKFADFVRTNQAIILKMLENGNLSSQERIEIIRKLSELSNKIADTQVVSTIEIEKTKRWGIATICVTALAAIATVAIGIVISRDAES